MEKIDARGLDCPAPVLKVKELIEKKRPDIIHVIVDNDAARQNVSRFFSSQNYSAEFQQEGSDFYITGTSEKACDVFVPETPKRQSDTKQIMIMIATDRIGFGDDQLGKKLMINFIKTLKEMGKDLWRLVFVNNGVKLSISKSEAISDLKELEENGVSILVCGTCLSHFNLLDDKDVGETTNMLDIVTSMQYADKVINM